MLQTKSSFLSLLVFMGGAILGYKLRASSLLGGSSMTWASLPAPYLCFVNCTLRVFSIFYKLFCTYLHFSYFRLFLLVDPRLLWYGIFPDGRHPFNISLFLVVLGGWTLDLTLARQVLYHLIWSVPSFLLIISCSADLLVLNYISFCTSENVFILHTFRNMFSIGLRIFD
jgi:hypothetical protein